MRPPVKWWSFFAKNNNCLLNIVRHVTKFKVHTFSKKKEIVKKKLIVLFLAFMMVFALVACKQDVEDTTTTNVSEDEGKENLVKQGAASGSKDVDGNGFRLVGTFDVNGTVTTVELGGKDGIYWIGSDVANAVFLSETKNSDDSYTVKVYKDSSWSTEYTVSSSIKDAIFADIADSVLYCGFSLKENGFSAEGAMTGTGTYGDDNRACTIYTASVSDGKYDLLTATIYVDNEYAITLGMEIEFSDHLKDLVSTLSDEALNAALKSAGALFEYSVDADFNLSATDLEEVTGYAEAYTALYGSN